MLNTPIHCIDTDTVVIGAGPTGLATSNLLKKHNIPHIVLERDHQVCSSWHALWDNYHLAMPASQVEFPGVDFKELFDDDHHPTRDQLIDFFEQYVKSNHLPIRLNAGVQHIYKNADEEFIIRTAKYQYCCKHVICCIGPRQAPFIPDPSLATDHADKLQVLHSSEYRTASQFPSSSKILVIGSGLSALSLAKDVHSQNHHVTLACAYTEHEIEQKNNHIFSEPVNTAVIPTLSSLNDLGINNLGRYLYHTDNKLVFSKNDDNKSVPISQFDIVIFATGFVRSYDILSQLFPPKSSERPQTELEHLRSIDGLYLAGIPAENQQTVIISEGTQDAQRVVAQILSKSKTEHQPKALASKI